MLRAIAPDVIPGAPSTGPGTPHALYETRGGSESTPAASPGSSGCPSGRRSSGYWLSGPVSRSPCISVRLALCFHAVIAAAQDPDIGQITTVVATCVAALSAVVASVVATVALLRTRQSAGASQLYAFTVDWDALPMLGMRHRAAAGRLQSPPEFNRDGFEVLNFFETVGYMVNEIKVIPKRACWLAFSDVLTCYFEAFLPWINDYRGGDPTAYESLQWLETQMLEITSREFKRHGRQGDGRPTPKEIDVFLGEELALPDNRDALATTTRIVAMPTITVRPGGWRWLRRRAPGPG